ncbi:MAG TPA: nucleoside transporter C-terminal domain-containing protein [Holophagaceae bacterium]|nr:nucleoside transporter C-terminal domain-containing protein [Holophagaceae bacterium]
MARFTGLLGILVFLLIGWALSSDRKRISWRIVGWGLALQWIFAVIVLRGEWIASALGFLPFPKGAGWAVLVLMFLPTLLRRFAKVQDRRLTWTVFALVVLGLLRGNLVGASFDRMRVVVEQLMAYAKAGATFVFGGLADPGGSIGLVFAFVVLPTIILVASLFAALYYAGVMQWVVGAAAKAMGRLLKISGAESVSVAASILMGQTEAPLTIRPFLARMTLSELMVIMTAGMAHVSGSIMVAYVQVAHVDIVHLLTAVIMTAPGAVMMAKILVPETEVPETGGAVTVDIPNHDANLVDALSRGALEGGQLAFNVAVMLIAFIALVALANGLLHAVHGTWSLEAALGAAFKPLAWLMGVPWTDAGRVGQLLGERMVTNEFVAFIDLGRMGTGAVPALASAKSRIIATFALCGFANFSSIAIQIGGIGALAPERRGDLARLGVKAMIAGTLANFLSACIAGVLL